MWPFLEWTRFEGIVILARSLEQSLSDAFNQIPEELRGQTHGADVTVRLVIQVSSNQIVSEVAPDPESALSQEADTETTAKGTRSPVSDRLSHHSFRGYTRFCTKKPPE